MGLPMYRVGTGATLRRRQPAITSTDSATGLPVAPFSVTPSFDQGRHRDRRLLRLGRRVRREPPPDRADDEARRHAAGPRRARRADHRPHLDRRDQFRRRLQPGRRRPLGLHARARRRRHLPDEAAVDRFAGDPAGNAPAARALQWPVPERRHPGGAGDRNQRRFTSLTGNVFYTPPSATDFTPSTFGPVSVTQAGGTVGFAVDITDNVGGGRREARPRALQGCQWALEAHRDVARLVPLERRRPARRHRRSSGSSRRSTDPATSRSRATRRWHETVLQPEPPTGDIQAEATGPQTNGWFTRHRDPSVTISGAPGITHSLDGAPFSAAAPSLTVSSVNGTGVHTAGLPGHRRLPRLARGPDRRLESNRHGERDVRLRLGRPCALRRLRLGDRVLHRPRSPSTRARPGRRRSRCTPRIGPATRSTPPHLRSAGVYLHRLLPADRQPADLNLANAGSSIPVKFSLSGFRGLNLFAPGYPASQPITCPNGGGMTSKISPPGGSTLTYNPLTDQYKYGWQTDRRWKGTCRKLIVRLKDGTEKRANFRFR